jgi:hypothetical protein
MIKRILFGILLLISALSQAQQGGILRGEIESQPYDFMYFLPVGKPGLIALLHKNRFAGNSDFWEIRQYSTQLKLVYKKEFTTGPGRKLIDYKQDKDSLLYAFFATESGGSRFEVVRYNYLTGRIETLKVKSIEASNWTAFDKAGKTWFATGTTNPGAGAYFLQGLYSLTIYPLVTGSKAYKIIPTVLWKDAAKGNTGTLKLFDRGITTWVL